jgi:hypothetical protein
MDSVLPHPSYNTSSVVLVVVVVDVVSVVEVVTVTGETVIDVGEAELFLFVFMH